MMVVTMSHEEGKKQKQKQKKNKHVEEKDDDELRRSVEDCKWGASHGKLRQVLGTGKRSDVMTGLHLH